MDLKNLEENAVRLVGFSVSHTDDDNSGVSASYQNEKANNDVDDSGSNMTIKVNGTVPNNHLDLENGASVKLVGFSRSSSLGQADLDRLQKKHNGHCPLSPDLSKVHLRRLRAEAQEHLFKGERKISGGNSSEEQFSEFIKENRERFKEMFKDFSRVLSASSSSSSCDKAIYSAPSSPTSRLEVIQSTEVTSNGKCSTLISSSSSPKPLCQMTISKSVYEFCGDANTYRFCTERMTHSYDQSFDFSDSEDEDEGTEETASCSSREDDSLSADCDSRIIISGPRESLEKSYLDGKAAFNVAHELLTSERTYVNVLHLIDQVFQFQVDHENRARPMFPQEVITRIFSNVKSIYKLHHDFLLPQLEERLANWCKIPRIGDIIKNFAPFLKMYTEYVKTFDDANATISLWLSKSPRFATIVEEIQKLPICGSLTLQHHMLAPVQRVPRYELLLKDYLSKLSEDSPDRKDAEDSLLLVSTAANQSNEAAKKIDKFKKLLEVQDLIGGSIDLVSPTRELIKAGKVVKISARNGDHQDRKLFLFTDLVLLCSPRHIANRVVSSAHSTYRMRARLHIDGLEVTEGDNLVTANTFYIRNNHKSIELYTHTSEERDDWLKALEATVEQLRRRKSSLRVTEEDCKTGNCTLGLQPPLLPTVQTDGMETCVVCKTVFGTFKRRQMCRACGNTVCGKCSNQKILLQYDRNRPHRVCKLCHDILTSSVASSSANFYTSVSNNGVDGNKNTYQNGDTVTTPTSPTLLDYGNSILRRGILEVNALDDCVLNGHLYLKTRGKIWTERWFVLKDDFVLYSFSSKEDMRAMTSTPVPGFQVALCDRSTGFDRDNVFRLFHKKKSYFFQAPNEVELKKWTDALERASRAEVISTL